jgi:hypothetical protein
VKPISDVTCCVVDNGLFLGFARRMSQSCKRTLFVPSCWQRGFCSIKDAGIGSGFEGIEHCLDFWPQLNDIDLFVFPDNGNAGLQHHLENIGKVVWGARKGDVIEQNRMRFLDELKHLGLEVPPHKVAHGIQELTAILKDSKDVYIKMSRWRADFETTHWRSWQEDWPWLDHVATKLGPFKKLLTFLVFEKIDTDLEIGGDTFCIDGQWPSLMLNGYEWKDNCYFSAVTPKEKMPTQIQEILEAFGPLLRDYSYRSQWSMEDRVKDDKHYFIDATCRGGMPSSMSQYSAWSNWPEIVWAGAQGELVEPVPSRQFTIEAMVKSKVEGDCWDRLMIDPKLEPHLMLSSCCKVDDVLWFPPDGQRAGDLGWLVATGNSPIETLDRAKELCDMLPDGFDANLEAMAHIINEVEEGMSKGVPFTKKELPKSAEVIAD